MVYQCDRCGAVLSPGARACATCGRLFDSPVPADAEVPISGVDAVLQGRTAAGSDTYRTSSSGLTPTIPLETVQRTRPWIAITVIAVVVLLLLGSVFGGAYLVWMHGPGGSMSFMEANNAGNDAFSRGDYVTADADYGRMIELRPDLPDGYTLRAISEFNQRQMMRSIADDTAGLAHTTDFDERADLIGNRGHAEAARGDLRDAIADYTAADALYRQITIPQELAEEPGEREANLRLRAQAYLDHKDYRQASADCSALISQRTTQPDDFFERGKAEAALGQYPAAWSDMGRAINRDPSYVPSQIAMNGLADQTHQYSQALAICKAAVMHSPDNVGLWGDLGWYQYKVGQIPAAIATDKHAQSLDPSQGWINFNLALCYAVTGNQAQSSAAYAAALATSAAPDRQGALGDLRDALARHPTSVPLKLAKAQVQQGLTLPAASPTHAAPQVAPLFAALLAPPMNLGGFSICPPRGYTLQQTHDQGYDGSSSTALWTGPPRADGTTPTLEVWESGDDGTFAEHANSVQVAKSALASVSSNHTQVVTTPVTPCAIGGRQFERANWSGIGQKTGKPYAGVYF